jgi:hypothetical protein
MNPLLACAATLSTFILAGNAHAEGPLPVQHAPRNQVQISIQAAPSTELEIEPVGAPEGSAVIRRCMGYCTVRVPPGVYSVYARSEDDEEPKRHSFSTQQSSRFVLDPGNRGLQAAGLTLAISGMTAVPIGMFIVLLASSTVCDYDNCDTQAQREALRGGWIATLAGAVATPVGWVLFAKSRPRLKPIDESEHGAAEPSTEVRVGVVGLGLGAFRWALGADSELSRSRRRLWALRYGHVLTSAAGFVLE